MSIERQSSEKYYSDIAQLDTSGFPVVEASQSSITAENFTTLPMPLPMSPILNEKRHPIKPLGLPQISPVLHPGKPSGLLPASLGQLSPITEPGPLYSGIESYVQNPVTQSGQLSLWKSIGYPQQVAATTFQVAYAATQAASEQLEAKQVKKIRKPLRMADKISSVLPPVLAFVVPFLFYNLLAHFNIDISQLVYAIVVISLLSTAYFIGVEAFIALRVDNPPEDPVMPYPPASAIIAAYLPNEAETIVETVNVMLHNIEYPASFQLILAYNTPCDMPVEDTLREIARRDSRLQLLRVENSTSKAENVNRALEDVTGDFVGVFDADHHPAPNCFTRAWRCLAEGCDVVQGHCVIRNGSNSWVARLVAVDFEVIYSLGHPGRTRMHGFGVFGGSNGYWRTGLLRQTGMQHTMLTEDIDSSIRVIQQGYRIAYDPMIISRELAPEALKTLWNQRMRWAQGWFQVSLKHFLPAMRSPHLTLRQKLGIIHLLGWRELYMWLSVQILPVLVFRALHGNIDWLNPFFLLSSIFTLCIGPIQVLLAYYTAAPEIKQHRGWFLSYALLSLLFFTGWKNHISRVAHLKEALGECEWKVTPRTTAAAANGKRD